MSFFIILFLSSHFAPFLPPVQPFPSHFSSGPMSSTCCTFRLPLNDTQVFHQQQQEREKQLVLQREQLAQQKSQLDQIQSLQHQLQQQLEEQKRQKTATAQVSHNIQAQQSWQRTGIDPDDPTEESKSQSKSRLKGLLELGEGGREGLGGVKN